MTAKMYLTFITDGSKLKFTNVRREDGGAYLCMASNGIPPTVSRRFELVVECKYNLQILLVDGVYETNRQSTVDSVWNNGVGWVKKCIQNTEMYPNTENVFKYTKKFPDTNIIIQIQKYIFKIHFLCILIHFLYLDTFSVECNTVIE